MRPARLPHALLLLAAVACGSDRSELAAVLDEALTDAPAERAFPLPTFRVQHPDLRAPEEPPQLTLAGLDWRPAPPLRVVREPAGWRLQGSPRTGLLAWAELPRNGGPLTLRVRLRPDWMEYDAGFSVTLGRSGGPDQLVISVGRGGGSGARTFRFVVDARFPKCERLASPVVEGVDLDLLLQVTDDPPRLTFRLTDGLGWVRLEKRVDLPPDQTAFLEAPQEIRLHVGGQTQEHRQPEMDLLLQELSVWRRGTP